VCDKEAGRPCVAHLLDDIQRLYIRYQQEYDITVVEYIGVLEAMKYEALELITKAQDDADAADDGL
jgi:hypothetical protein